MGLVLTFLQITVLKGFQRMLEGRLRVVTITTNTAGEQKEKSKNYGTVWPLDLTVAAATVPCPMHPSFILMAVSSKYTSGLEEPS